MAEHEDDALLVAAANWAESSSETKPASNSNNPNNQLSAGEVRRSISSTPERRERKTSEEKKTYSLHVTQLSYDATDYDIRDLFISKGCLVTSVRLVYTNRDSETLIRKFKGVAFVDVADEASFALAAELHRTYHLGRRINVRPTLSRDELACIAEATKEKVNDIIQTSATATSGDQSVRDTVAKKKPKSDNMKTTVRPPKSDKRKSNPRKAHKRLVREDVKLTKKERNRKVRFDVYCVAVSVVAAWMVALTHFIMYNSVKGCHSTREKKVRPEINVFVITLGVPSCQSNFAVVMISSVLTTVIDVMHDTVNLIPTNQLLPLAMNLV